MVGSIDSSAVNPLLSYQTAPVAPIAGSTPGSAASDPAAQRQSELEAKIQSFEDYLNGQVTGDAAQQTSTAIDQTADTSSTEGDNTIGNDQSQLLTSYALTDLDVQIQNFEAYLNQQSGFQATDATPANGQQQSSSPDEAATELQGQLQALEAYVARQALALGQAQTSQGPSPSVAPQTASTSPAVSQDPPTAKPIDLGAVVNALERYLSKQGPAAISDPIQAQTTTPIPVYQTVQGRQDPLPLDGPEQAAKTSSQQSEAKHDALSRDLAHFLDDLAILNLVANKKSIEFDPVRDLENKSTYKPPGESSPI